MNHPLLHRMWEVHESPTFMTNIGVSWIGQGIRTPINTDWSGFTRRFLICVVLGTSPLAAFMGASRIAHFYDEYRCFMDRPRDTCADQHGLERIYTALFDMGGAWNIPSCCIHGSFMNRPLLHRMWELHESPTFMTNIGVSWIGQGIRTPINTDWSGFTRRFLIWVVLGTSPLAAFMGAS
ncbi:MAG: hypothetical protein M5R41_04890 [Bacteroidia bacterium]|nr:hypothetical protein [Bacteroidia bacterium]